MNTNISCMNDLTVTGIARESDLSPLAIGDLFLQAKATHAESVNYLIECGRRLQIKRKSLNYGEWLPWLKVNEEALGFGERTAQLLIKAAATNPQLTSDLPPAEAAKINRAIWGNNRQARITSTTIAPVSDTPVSPSPDTDEHGASAVRTPGKRLSNRFETPVQAGASDGDEPERPDMEALDREAAENYAHAREASLDKLLDSNDALAAAVKEIERQAHEIAVLKVSRDGFMNGKDAVRRLLVDEQNKNEKLSRWLDDLKRGNERLERQKADLQAELQRANDKIHDLTERIAQMEVE